MHFYSISSNVKRCLDGAPHPLAIGYSMSIGVGPRFITTSNSK